MTIEWPARLAPKWDADLIDEDGQVLGRARTIICSRPTGAETHCDAMVGRVIYWFNVLGIQVYAPNGYREVEPGRWGMVGYARKRRKRGSPARTQPYQTDDGRKVHIEPHATVPYTIPCWRCRDVARVGIDVVESGAT
jgi:hypothetical protein